MVDFWWPKTGNSAFKNFNGSIDASFSNGIALRFKGIVAAFFYSVFALGVNDHAALFGLLFGMAAHFHQGLNHPFKSVHFVVPYN